MGHARYLLLLFFFPMPLFAQYSYEHGTHLDDDLRLFCNRETAYSTGVSDARKGLARKEDYAEICQVNRATLNAAYNTGYQYGLTNQFGLIVNEPSPGHPGTYQQLPSSYVQPYTRPVTVVTNPNVPEDTGYGSVVAVQGVPGVATSTGNSIPSRPPVYPSEEGVPTGDFAKPEPQHGLKSLIEIAPSAHPKCIETVTGQACGFNCVNSLNNVRCAKTPDQVCRSNGVGDIACGYNCVSTNKSVRCALFPSDNCVSDNNGNVYCGINCRIERNAIALCDIERYAPN